MTLHGMYMRAQVLYATRSFSDNIFWNIRESRNATDLAAPVQDYDNCICMIRLSMNLATEVPKN